MSYAIGYLGLSGASTQWAEAELAAIEASLNNEMYAHPVFAGERQQLMTRLMALLTAVRQGGGVPDDVAAQIRDLKRDVWWHQPIASHGSWATRGNAIVAGSSVAALGLAFVGWRIWRRKR